MHVLIIPSWYPASPDDIGGSFFREQAQALVGAGCKVGVIFPHLRSLRQWWTVLSGPYGLAEEHEEGVFTLRRHGMRWFPKLPRLRAWQWMSQGRRMYEEYAEKNGRPDVIHAHGLLYAGCVAGDISHDVGVPYVVTEHTSAYARDLASRSQCRMARIAASSAARRFAVSEPFCQLLATKLKMQPTDWVYLPNLVHAAFLAAPLVVSPIADSFVFLHISSLDSNKAADLLIKAFSRAFGGDYKVSLRIGGEGPMRGALEKVALELGVAGQVQFLGKLVRNSVIRELQACNAFALSSRHETFGVVLIEALALGKPVIATRCGGPESIVRKQDGFLVDIDDVAGLSWAMRQIRDNYDNYDSVKIRASCAARFSEQAVTEKLISEYAAVCIEAQLRTD